jgi:hypothetical protein
LRYRSGPLPMVAMELLKTTNARHLFLDEEDLNFRKLKAFLKRLFVRVKPNGRKKQIRDLMPFAGEFVFNKETGHTTVQVRVIYFLVTYSNAQHFLPETFHGGV